MARKLYQLIAARLDAARNCERSGNEVWLERHLAIAGALVSEHMPSGSGVDAGTRLDIEACKTDRLVFSAGWHRMNGVGMYAGWQDYLISVRPTFDGFTLRITGKDRDGIKDYLGELFAFALEQELGEQAEIDLALRFGPVAKTPATVEAPATVAAPNLDRIEAALVAIRKTTNEDETLGNVNEALATLKGGRS